MTSKITKLLPAVIGGGGGGVQSVVAGAGISVDNADPLNPIVSSIAARAKVLYFAANPLGAPHYYLVDGEPFWRQSINGAVTAFGSGGVPQSAGTIGINTSVAVGLSDFRFWDGFQEVQGFQNWQISNIQVEAQVSFPNWGKTGFYTSSTTGGWANMYISRDASNLLTAFTLQTAANGIFFNNASVAGHDFGGSANTFNTTARQFRYKVTVIK